MTNSVFNNFFFSLQYVVLKFKIKINKPSQFCLITGNIICNFLVQINSGT